MTTIAYRDGVLAADTLISRNETVAGYATKIAKHGPVLAGICGAMPIGQGFLDWFKAGMKGEPPAMKVGDQTAIGIIVFDGWIIELGAEGWDRLRHDYAAWGSGSQLALGAMRAGSSAEEAVRSACAIDHHSGGEITVLQSAQMWRTHTRVVTNGVGRWQRNRFLSPSSASWRD